MHPPLPESSNKPPRRAVLSCTQGCVYSRGGHVSVVVICHSRADPGSVLRLTQKSRLRAPSLKLHSHMQFTEKLQVAPPTPPQPSFPSSLERVASAAI